MGKSHSPIKLLAKKNCACATQIIKILTLNNIIMKERITERDLKNPEYRGFPTEEKSSKLQDDKTELKATFPDQASNLKSQNSLDNK